jgi:uncharacterized protein (TIGR03663 family)
MTRPTAWTIAAGAAILVVAAALRLSALGDRPMHTDEAVHTFKFADLWLRGRYAYDPNDYHGPTLYYLTLPIAAAHPAETFEQTDAGMYRLAPAVAGIALVAMTLALAGGLSTRGAWLAAAAMAVSPAMVFYSRYYIQETLLVAWTAGALLAGWRFARTRQVGWCAVLGLTGGLMIATKETWVIVAGAAGAGAVLVGLWRRREGVGGRHAHLLRPAGWAVAGGVALVAATLLLSTFGRDLTGPVDAVRALGKYLGRAEGAGKHAHPWYAYLHMLSWWRTGGGPAFTEGVVLILSAVGAGASLAGRGPRGANIWLGRFLTVYTLVMLAVYSAIPYKTPWCVLGMLHGMCLLAGLGAAVVLEVPRGWASKTAAAGLLLAGGAQLAAQAARANFQMPADPANPYVYAHPPRDVTAVGRQVRRLARAGGEPATVHVIWTDADYWPLPWTLRDLSRVGWFDDVPVGPRPDVLIVDERKLDEVTTWLYGGEETRRLYIDVFGQSFPLRPGERGRVLAAADVYNALQRQARPVADDPNRP